MDKFYGEKLQHLARSYVECGREKTSSKKTDHILYVKTSSFLDKMRVHLNRENL